MISGLLYRLNAGEENALKEVFYKFHDQLTGYLFNRGLDTYDDCDKLVTEVFISLWRNIKTGFILESDKHLNDVLYKSVINKLRTFKLRQKGPKKRLVAYVEHIENYDTEDTPYNEAENKAFKRAVERVKRAIRKLPPQCKTIFKMWAFDNMSFEEIGTALTISPQTARNQKTRAIMLLKKRLKVKP